MGRFMLTLADGEQVTTEPVVAAGIATAFLCRAPSALPTSLLHASQHSDLGCFCGRRVVVGCGQSALESAALLHERGAGGYRRGAPAVRWLNQRPVAARARSGVHCCTPHPRLAAAAQSAGPGAGFGAPDAVPQPARLDRRSIRPAGAGWLKPRIDGKVTIHNCSS